MISAVRARRAKQLRLTERRWLLVVGDLSATLVAVTVALLASALWTGLSANWRHHMVAQSHWYVVLVGMWLLLASANDFYNLPRVNTRHAVLPKMALLQLQLGLLYLLMLLLPEATMPRSFLLSYAVLSAGLVTVWRMTSFTVLDWAGTARRVLVLGGHSAAERIIDAIQQSVPDAYHVVGVITQEGHAVRGVPHVAPDALLDVLHAEGVAELVLTGNAGLDQSALDKVLRAYETGVTVVPMPLLYERITSRVPVAHVHDDWATVLPVQRGLGVNLYDGVKRLLDVLFALVGLAVFGMMLPMLALIIRLDSAGGVFYSQTRVGRYGRTFTLYKLRTMVLNAEARTGVVFTTKNDARITRVGNFMRKTRLDELPQLVNVLRGEMSLIGPRPERPEHVARLEQSIPYYNMRCLVAPGLTGWAQVCYDYGENDADALAKLEYDLYYVRHASLLLDLNILVRTTHKVLQMQGR